MHRVRSMAHLLGLLTVFVPGMCVRAQESKTWTCEAFPEVRAALWTQADPTRPWPLWSSMHSPLTNWTALGGTVPRLVERFPGDFWVERARIDAARNLAGVAADAVITEFEQRYQAASKDPEAAYLYGYALINKDTARTIELLTAVTAETPEFPAAWMTLANIYDYHFKSWAWDENKTQAFGEGYVLRCPGSLQGDAISLLTSLKPSRTLTAYTRALRERIAGKADAATLPFYTLLWTLESKGASQEQLDALRASRGEDLKFLSSLDQHKYPLVTEVLATGQALLAGDAQPQAARVVFIRALLDWDKANPQPKADAGLEAVNGYHRKRLAFLDEWRAKLPDEPQLLATRMNELASLDDTPGDVLVAAGERLLAASKASGDDWAIDVAKAWAKRGVAGDKVPGLVNEYLEWKKASMSYYDSDLCRGTFYELRKYRDLWYVNADAWEALALAQIDQGQLSEARATLKNFETALPELRARVALIRTKYTTRASEPSGAQPVENFPVVEDDTAYLLKWAEEVYNETRGHLAEREGRNLDALAYYQAAVQTGEAGLDTVVHALELWRSLGGTPEALPAWKTPSLAADTFSAIDAAIFPSDWIPTSRALLDFSLQDRHGRQWTLADFKGKTMFISVWATWCPPCRAELPQVQALFEKVAGRKDVQLVTLNVDSERLAVEPFLKEHNYSFPVIYADWDYVDRFLEKAWGSEIPQAWIADSNGIVRFRDLDYDESDAKWLEKALATIAKVH